MPHLILAKRAHHARNLAIQISFHLAYGSYDNLELTQEDAELVGTTKAYAVLSLESDEVLYDCDIVRYLHRKSQGSHPCLNEITEWLDVIDAFVESDSGKWETSLLKLEAHLGLQFFIAEFSAGVTDAIVWGAIHQNEPLMSSVKQRGGAVARWLHYAATPIENLEFEDMAMLIGGATAGNALSPNDDTSRDRSIVVTRFLLEPSGCIHIGHAMSALLNERFAHNQDGMFILRFDDANPSKGMLFSNEIVHDLAMMGVIPDKITFSSDYFQFMHDSCATLISTGDAYADDSTDENIARQRKKGLPSPHRHMAWETAFQIFEKMKDGSAEGIKWCIRAKISADHPNEAMQDPVIYRCDLQPHHRSGNTWKIYPTDEFCVPVLDSIEDISCAWRPTEYPNGDAQYHWIQDALAIKSVTVHEFPRLNFERTVLSRRKLSALIERGTVNGWADPRLPTIRGLRQRGLTMTALREFISKQGPSPSFLPLEHSALWALNKRILELKAPRHTAIIEKEVVGASVVGGEKKLGNVYGTLILIEQADALSIKTGEEITLINLGHFFVREILQNAKGVITKVVFELREGGNKKKECKKIPWLSAPETENHIVLVEYDFLLIQSKIEKNDNILEFVDPVGKFLQPAFTDCDFSEFQEGKIVHFEQKGLYRFCFGGPGAPLFCLLPDGVKTDRPPGCPPKRLFMDHFFFHYE